MIVQPTLSQLLLIAGSSGSGKGEVAKKIVREVGKEYVEHRELDMFYLDRSDIPPEERDKIDFDDPLSLSWIEVIHFALCLKEGKSAILPCYDFGTHTRILDKGEIVCPKPFTILDSHMALWHPELRKLARKKLFVDTDLDICAFRRQERDTRPKDQGGRGRTNESVRQQWPQVRKAFKLHFEPTKEFANLIIPEGGENDEGIDIIIGWMKHELEKKIDKKPRRSHKKK